MENENEIILSDDEDLAVNAENVEEQATEEVVEGEETTAEATESEETKVDEEKKYTEKEFNEKLNDLLSKKLARKEARIRKVYENKYSPLEHVVKSGLGVNDLSEATSKLKDYYVENGVDIPPERQYSEEDERILARAEATEIIDSDDVDSEIEALNRKQNLTTREKVVYDILTNHKQEKEELKELKKIGAEEILKDKAFLDFKKNFRKDIPIKEVYGYYEQMTVKEDKPIGSMKSTNKNLEKEYITEEEYSKLTSKDFDDPKVFERIRKSIEKGLITP